MSAIPPDMPAASATVTNQAQTSSDSPRDPSARSTARRATTRPLDLEDRALVLLMKHPDWSNVRLADELTCHPKSLSRLTRFKNARAINKANKHEFPTRDDF